MKKVIYIGAGITAVNVVNAGCCDSNSGKKSISLSDVEISFINVSDNEKVDCKKMDDDIKNDFDRYYNMFKAMFKFEKGDIASNVSIFSGTSSKRVSVYILVGTDAIVEKQEDKVKNMLIQKLGDSGLNVCCVFDPGKGSVGPIVKNKVSIEADKGKKTKFNIKIR